MSETTPDLVEQLQTQRQQLENQIREGELSIARSKEQYLKVMGALEFATIQQQQAESSTDDSTEVVEGS
jgi:hypothetical protein|tara:strand:- start:13 stop:219 length:207 start_codon:yes stop_codon:yes gene_type:complete